MKTYKHQLAEAQEQILALKKQLRDLQGCPPVGRTGENLAAEAADCIEANRLRGSALRTYLAAWISDCALDGDLDALRRGRDLAHRRHERALEREEAQPATEGAGPSLTFAQLRETNAARCEAHYHPVDAWSLSDWCTAVAGEVGELAGVVKNLRRQQTEAPNGHAIPEVDAAKLGAEAADVVIYLDLLCARAGVGLGRAVAEKFNDVSRGRLGTEAFLLPEGP